MTQGVGLDDALSAAKRLGVILVPGVEVSLRFRRDFFVGTLHYLLYVPYALLEDPEFRKEAENTLKREGVWGLVPKGGASNLTLVFDRTRLEKMAKAGGIQDMGRGLQQILKENTAPHIEKMPAMIQTLGQLAYLWGPDALAKLNEGVAIGLKEFLDEEGRPINESVRQNIYEFLLLAWPEIEEMLNAKPKKNVGDLHKWMLPFMRRDMCNLIGPDYLRDVCAPMPSGIGLALRPLSSRSARPSD